MPSNQESTGVSSLRQCVQVFSKSDQRKIFAVILLQIFLGVLDLVGVVIIGIIGALAVTGVQSSEPGNRVNLALKVLKLNNFTFQEQTAILGLLAVVILVGRTTLSIFFTRRILFFIGRRSAVISINLLSRALQQNILKIHARTVQETIYALTTGVNSITLGVVGVAVSLIADTSLLLVMAIGLVLVDPIIAFSTFLMFGAVGFILYRFMHTRAIKIGRSDAELNMQSNERISEVITSYREATVRDRRSFYSSEIGSSRLKLSNVLAELSFMPTISKYVIEIALVVGAFMMAAIQFTAQDSRHAVATLAVFLAAGTRIAPAVLRVQQGTIAIRSGIGAAKPTLDLIESLPELIPFKGIPNYNSNYPEFVPKIEIKNLSFCYPNSASHALKDLNLTIPTGSTCAIVGPSGSGKTTLVDLILGMFEPSSGSITISGSHPLNAIQKFPGAIGYVPQDVSIIHGSIRDNVAMGFPESDATDERIFAALEIAQLLEYVKTLPSGIDTQVGARGTKLSGGQRQRLGIARAMFTKPRLIILDESTSALDAQTEADVSQAILNIPYEVTVIIIAHRLSTVRQASQIVYLNLGRTVTIGNFNEVRESVPDFDIQAKMMGL